MMYCDDIHVTRRHVVGILNVNKYWVKTQKFVQDSAYFERCRLVIINFTHGSLIASKPKITTTLYCCNIRYHSVYMLHIICWCNEAKDVFGVNARNAKVQYVCTLGEVTPSVTRLHIGGTLNKNKE